MAKITGNAATKKVFIDGVELTPDESMKLRTHSAEGFGWGGGGPRAAQLALAICMKYNEKPLGIYQDFKNKFIGRMDGGKNFTLDSIDVLDWIENTATQLCGECGCPITVVTARKFKGHCETCHDRIYPDAVPEDERPGANAGRGA